MSDHPNDAVPSAAPSAGPDAVPSAGADAVPSAGPNTAPSTGPDTAPSAGPDTSLPASQTDYMADDQYREAVVDLLGALAYGELTAFERLADDATFAPTIADKAALARMAVAEYHHFELLRDRLKELGAAPELAMEPFTEALHSFHERTAPGDWLEGLVKAYVGDGIAEDFYREVSAYVDTSTRALVLQVLEDTGHSQFAVDRVRAAITEDPRLAGRLALWGRRLVGEALSQAQRVAAERDALSTLLVGGVDRPGADLAEVGRMFARLTENHTQRMSALGLTS